VLEELCDAAYFTPVVALNSTSEAAHPDQPCASFWVSSLSSQLSEVEFHVEPEVKPLVRHSSTFVAVQEADQVSCPMKVADRIDLPANFDVGNV
jgi:hypothetical protein